MISKTSKTILFGSEIFRGEKTGGERGDVEACEGVGAVGVSVRKERGGLVVGDEEMRRGVGGEAYPPILRNLGWRAAALAASARK